MEKTPDLARIWRGDPLLEYYNPNDLANVILTCDVDWAPDYAIERVLEIRARFGCKITMFATHPSKVLLDRPDGVEVAIHPDFTRGANSDFDEKMRILKEAYPRARGMRSHRNFFGQNISDLAKKHGLEYDASVFLWNEPFGQAQIDHNGIVRFTYFWEDGIHLKMGLPLSWEKVRVEEPGLKIFNVHPMLIYLNSTSDEHRKLVTSRYKDLAAAPRREIEPEVNRRRGITNLWIGLLERIETEGVKTHHLGDLAKLKRGSTA